KMLAAQSGRAVGLWDTATGKKLRNLHYPLNASLRNMAFSPDDKALALALWDEKAVWLVDVDTGKSIRQLALTKVSVERLAFAPDGKVLAVGDGLFLQAPKGKPPVIRLVDAVTGRELRQPLELPETAAALKQSSRIVEMGTLAFSADGRILAAA